MNCARFEPLIALYVESDLPEAETRLVAEHLEACGACRDFAAAMQESQAELKTLRSDRVDDSVYRQVRAAVLSEISRGRTTNVWPRYAIAAAFLLALLAGWIWRTRPKAIAEPRLTATVRVQVPPVVPVQIPPTGKPGGVVMRHAHRQPRPAPTFHSEPLLVKMLTDDPQVVIYWLVDQNGG